MKTQPEIDLGLEIAMRHAQHGGCMTYREIAAFAGVSWQAIYFIEKKALRRIRIKPEVRSLQRETVV